MKKNNLTLLFVCILSLALVLSGCSSETEELTQYSNSLYSITVEGTQYCLTATTDLSSVNTRAVIRFPTFSSIAEMRQGILSGSFTKENLFALTRASANGKIEICDLDNLFHCTTPSDFRINKIMWGGKYYQFNLTNISGGSLQGSVRCLDKETYTNRFNNEYMDFLSNPNVTVTGQEKIEDRSATVYYTTTDLAKLKRICYQLQEGDKHLYIREEYLLEHYSIPLSTSSTVPVRIYIWGTDNSGYFYGGFRDFSERPSVEWLFQFGLTPYVATSTT